MLKFDFDVGIKLNEDEKSLLEFYKILIETLPEMTIHDLAKNLGVYEHGDIKKIGNYKMGSGGQHIWCHKITNGFMNKKDERLFIIHDEIDYDEK